VGFQRQAGLERLAAQRQMLQQQQMQQGIDCMMMKETMPVTDWV